ncbi:MAG: POTRA domain-containing protein [Verrucomicrobiota bacterium]
MKIQKLTLALFLFLSVWLASCANQERHPADRERKITRLSLRNTTPKYVEDRRILALISSQPGTIYDEKKVDQDSRALYESGLVDDVKFSAKFEGQSVHLIATVVTRRGFGPVLFRLNANTKYSEITLWKQISRSHADRILRAVDRQLDPVTEKPIVYKDESLVSDLLPAVCIELENFYKRQGFKNARVRAESWNGGSPTIDDFHFTIEENAPET